jgi:hypothetical protein
MRYASFTSGYTAVGRKRFTKNPVLVERRALARISHTVAEMPGEPVENGIGVEADGASELSRVKVHMFVCA